MMTARKPHKTPNRLSRRHTDEPGLSQFRLLRHIIRGVLNLYYRSIESYGTNFLPRRGRTLLIANHQAGLLDGLLVLATNRTIIRTLIKHTLWNNPLIGFFATGLGMIPVFRRQDLKPEEIEKKSPSERHEESFSRLEQAMLADENALIFPEGISHDTSYVLRLRSGAARMLLQTEAKYDFRVGLQWMPVSIDLEVKDKPGGRVVMHYHPPRKIMKYRELYVHHPEDAVKALRKEMEDYLRDITLSFSSWEDRLFIERLMELWICQTPSELLLDRHNQLLKWKRILENTFVLPEEKGDWELLRKRVKRIHTTLEISGLTSRDIFAEHSEGSYQKMVVKLTPLLFFWLPLMLVGYVFWWIPTKIIQYATAKGTKGHRDIVATYHVVGAFILYPLWMALFFLITPWFADFKAMLVLGSLLIFCGYAVLAAARKIRVGFKEILNMYRYGSLQNMLIDLRSETHQVWSLAARLWNRGLSRQASLE